MNEKWFKRSISDIEKKLKTNAASGLSPAAARSRRSKASGQLFYLPRRSPLRIFLDILADFALVILILGAIFSLFFEIEEYLRGLTVFTTLLCSLVFCFVAYYRSQRLTESLPLFFYPTVRVIRGGRLFKIDCRSVVVGDIILLEKGDIVCADARLVSSDGLRVKMRSSQKEYILLEKDANAQVDPREIHVKNMSNMVHGGSAVLSGNARAIVCAVGKYTYLGAMTGGICLPVSKKQPQILERMRKTVSKLNIVILIGVLPFTMISLLLGNMLSERQSLLSVAFMCAMSIAATSLPQFMLVIMRIFYSHKMNAAITARDPSVVRSIESLDKLSSADYIFMLDGCAVTDGLLHLESAICAEGKIRAFSSMNKTATMFAEYAALYYTAATQTLTTGVSGSSEYMLGIKSFIDASHIDRGQLKIRCIHGKYFTGNMIDSPERLYFQDSGRNYCISVWRDISALKECNNIILNGTSMPLSDLGRENFERVWHKSQANGEIPILFVLSSEARGYSDGSFLGIITLKEGVDRALDKNLTTLDRLGCKVISFARRGQIPKMPLAVTERGCVVKASFERNKLPITYNFGSISAYSDMSDDDIITLIKFAHSQNKKVAIIGFSENALNIAKYADGFITCSDINARISGYFNEEIYAADIAGYEGSACCSQIVKERADCIITRPHRTRGGLLSVISLLGEIRSLYKNVSDFIRYSVCVQIVRAIVVGVPMLFGDAVLDARHVVLCAFVLDLMAFLAFMTRKNIYPDKRTKNYCDIKALKDFFIGDSSIIISVTVAAGLSIVLPRIADFFVGSYDYKLEGLFVSLLFIQLVVFGISYYANNFKDVRYIYKNKYYVTAVAFVALLLILCFTVPLIGTLFGVEGLMSPLYFAIAILPSVVCLAAFVLINKKRSSKKI